MKVVQLKAAKAAIEQKRYAAQVLTAYDRMDRAAKRSTVEKRVEVQRKAREAL